MKVLQWRAHRSPNLIDVNDPALVEITLDVSGMIYYHIRERVFLKKTRHEFGASWYTAKLPDMTQIDDVMEI